MRKSHSADDLLLALTSTSTSAQDNEEDNASTYSDWIGSNFFAASSNNNVDNNGGGMKNLMDDIDDNDNDNNDDNASTASSTATAPYFISSDFLPQQNWDSLTTVEVWGAGGFALIAGGLACFHPFVFVAGVLTAVGTLQAAGAAHDYCNNNEGGESSSDSFYNHCSNINSLLFCGNNDTTTTTTTLPEQAKDDQKGQQAGDNNTNTNSKSQTTGSYTFGEEDDDDNFSDDDDDNPMRQVSQLTFSQDSAEMQKMMLQEQQQRPQQRPQLTLKDSSKRSSIMQNHQSASALSLSHHQNNLDKTQQALQWVQDFYPPLPTMALERIEFHGLNANEFFDVFFSDAAPFGFQAFHKIRRDKNVRYGLWETLEGVKKPCLLAQAPIIADDQGNSSSTTSVPPVQERIVEYDAKTNSFLGPPFAKTTKVQRALQVSKRLLVMEMKTSLSDIPFSKNFYIMERWLVTSESHPEEFPSSCGSDTKKKKQRGRNSKTPQAATATTTPHHHHHHHGKRKMTSTAFLTITSQVVFTQTCAFESTILKESAKQIKEISSQWNKMAQEGLKRTEETRRQRLQEETEFEEEEDFWQDEKNDETDVIQSGMMMTLSQEQQQQAAFDNDESIEIHHMGRRNSWVAGDVYCPTSPSDLEDDFDVVPLKQDGGRFMDQQLQQQ
ncbi:MAG: hypothetical protein SGILL_005624 [Bacillariaceae sp.]